MTIFIAVLSYPPPMRVLTPILTASILQGLFLLIVLWRKSKRKPEGAWLAAFMTVIVGLQTGRLCYALDPESLWTHKLLLIADVMIFLLAPFQFTYLRHLSGASAPSRLADGVHVVPAMLYLLSTLPFLISDQTHYFYLIETGSVYFATVEILGIALNLLYFWYIRQQLQAIRARSEVWLSVARHPMFYYGILLTGPLLVFWILTFIAGQLFPHFQVGFVAYQLVWIMMSMLVFGFSYLAISYPDWFRGLPEVLVTPAQVSREVAGDEALFDQLKNLMEAQKPFLDPELTLSKLAAQTGLQAYELSRVINRGAGCHFFEFVNQYRVQEFQRLATPATLREMTILAVAYEAGFNAKSTFNEVFKRLTGQTPSQFLKKTRPDS